MLGLTAPEASDQPANPRAAVPALPDRLGERHDAPAERFLGDHHPGGGTECVDLSQHTQLSQAQHRGQPDPDVLLDAGADQ